MRSSMRALPWLLVLSMSVACDDAPAPGKAPPPEAKGAGDESLDPFSEYKRKSISGEARVNLKRIASGVRYAFEEERLENGVVVHGQLPASAPLTPAAVKCCKQPEGRCPVDLQAWDHPTWKAIAFAVESPHYYAYELETFKDGFVARAVGDLDCDGTPSKLELEGKIAGGALEVSELVEHDPLE